MNARAACAAAVLLALTFPAGAVRAADQPLSLTDLERKLTQAPVLEANQYDVAAAEAGVRVERAKSGLTYDYSAGVGQDRLIIPQPYNVFRLQQNAGVTLPLLGSKVAQQDAVVSAQERAQLAQIALAQTQRERLAALRAAYIRYWEYDNESHIALAYVSTQQQSLLQARGLRATGFWTSADMLDFLDAVEKVKTDAGNFANSERGQLAQVDFAIGTEIDPFAPVEPDFFNSCTVDRTRAVASAQAVDPTLAALAAQASQIRGELAAVKWAPVDASVGVQAGSVADIDHAGPGYGVQLELNVSVPAGARAEERALRDEYGAQLQSLALQQEQRRVEIAAAVDAALDEVQNAQAASRQARQDRAAREEDLSKAVIRYDTIKQAGSTGFNDVQDKRDELYVADRSSAEARANVLLDAATLMMIAPDACAAGTIAQKAGRVAEP